MGDRSGHLVPILDHGVTIDRGDHVIVVLDALGPDEVQREIADICAMLGQGWGGARPAEET